MRRTLRLGTALAALVALAALAILAASCAGQEWRAGKRTPGDVYFRCVQANNSGMTGKDAADCGLTVDYCQDVRQVVEKKHASLGDCLRACKEPRGRQPLSLETFTCERVFREGEWQCEVFCRENYPQ